MEEPKRDQTDCLKTRIMIVDDHPIVREGYVRLIERRKDL
jgi:hypothetical protein